MNVINEIKVFFFYIGEEISVAKIKLSEVFDTADVKLFRENFRNNLNGNFDVDRKGVATYKSEIIYAKLRKAHQPIDLKVVERSIISQKIVCEEVFKEKKQIALDRRHLEYYGQVAILDYTEEDHVNEAKAKNIHRIKHLIKKKYQDVDHSIVHLIQAAALKALYLKD